MRIKGLTLPTHCPDTYMEGKGGSIHDHACCGVGGLGITSEAQYVAQNCVFIRCESSSICRRSSSRFLLMVARSFHSARAAWTLRFISAAGPLGGTAYCSTMLFVYRARPSHRVTGPAATRAITLAPAVVALCVAGRVSSTGSYTEAARMRSTALVTRDLTARRLTWLK